ncbi:MAG: hypothetical protein ABFS14_06450 [Gemmatimonadota bacterium]
MDRIILRRALSVVPGVILTAQIAACSGADSVALSDDTYIRAMAELQALADSTRGEPADSAREAVLERVGTNQEQILAFAEAAGRDPERMERLWTAIQAAMDSAQTASDSAANAPAETGFGSVVTGGVARDTAPEASGQDSATADPQPPLADSAKIRAIRDRIRQRGVPQP